MILTKVLVISGVSVALVVLMFVMGRLLDKGGDHEMSPQNENTPSRD